MFTIAARRARQSTLAWTACVHPERRIDRFGHEVCTAFPCGFVTDRWAGTPNAGLEGCQ